MNLGAFFRSPAGWFLTLVFGGCLLAGLMLLGSFLIPGDGGAMAYLIWLYGLLPLAAAILPYFAGRRGLHPMAAFFPIGASALPFSLAAPWMPLACMGISLVAATAGQEMKKRKETETKSRHGRKSN